MQSIADLELELGSFVNKPSLVHLLNDLRLYKLRTRALECWVRFIYYMSLKLELELGSIIKRAETLLAHESSIRLQP